MVQWVEYLTIDPTSGNIVTRQCANNTVEFGAVICSLGSVGFITRINTNVVPELYFNAEQKIVLLSDVLNDLDKTTAQYQFWRVNWIPNTDQGLLWNAVPVPASESKPDGEFLFTLYCFSFRSNEL